MVMPCWEVCVCQLARGGVADPVPAGVLCHRTLRGDPPAPRHRHRERGTELARSWHGPWQLSEGLVAEGSRRGHSVSMLQSACLWRSLALEPCLVIGEDFTSGGAGAGLPWVFKLCLCVAAWQARAVTLSVSRAGLGELNETAPALLPPCSSALLAAP